MDETNHITGMPSTYFGTECSECSKPIVNGVWQCKCREQHRNGMIFIFGIIAFNIIISVISYWYHNVLGL